MIEVAMKRVDRVSRWGLQVENCWSVPIAALAQAAGVDAVQRSSAPKQSHSRRVGCDFLGLLGTADPAVIPALVAAVQSGPALVQTAAAEALGQIGPAAAQWSIDLKCQSFIQAAKK